MSAERTLMRFISRACLALLMAPWLQAAAQPVQENAMKAAFVYNFVLFTDWPQEAFRDVPTLNVCVNVDSAMRAPLLMLKGKPAKGQSLRVIAKKLLDHGLSQCHVLYIEGIDRERWPALREMAGKARILTISDDEEIGRSGVMIALELSENRMVFDIDQSAARQSQLTFSSKLLRLARTVR